MRTTPAPRETEERPTSAWRQRLFVIIFEADTPAGKAFDVALLAVILLSVFAVCLESVSAWRQRFPATFRVSEWIFTTLFLIEYVLRLMSVRSPMRYATSFFGVIDVAAILPTFVSVFVPGAQSLIVVRAFRLLRVFRIFKLARFLGEAYVLARALRQSLPKITVFIGAVLAVVLAVGALMYFIEGESSGFTSIPTGMYWAIVTMTTVGYGDIAPATVPGRFLASALMILGYGVLAVPTGIVSVELATAVRLEAQRSCPACAQEEHDTDARFCKACGAALLVPIERRGTD